MGIIRKIAHEGVEMLRVARFRGRVNSEFSVYRIGHTLIDTGPPNQSALVVSYAKEHKITRALISHHHEDHAGAGHALMKEGVEVLAPAASFPLLSNGYPIEYYRRIVWGNLIPFTPSGIIPDVLDVEGLKMHLLPAPGHSPDHHCFWFPEKGWLFSADMFVTKQPKVTRYDQDPNIEIETMRKLVQYDTRVLFCAHRGIVLDGKKALSERLEFFVSTRDKVMRLLDKGWTEKMIREEVLGKGEDVFAWMTRFDFSKRNLIRSFIAYANAQRSRKI